MFGLAEGEAVPPLFDQDGADPLGPGILRHTAVNHINLGVAGARAPAFLAVDDDAIAPDLGPCRQIGQRRTGVRFRHRDRDDHLAGANLGQYPRLHRLGRKTGDGQGRSEAGFEDRKGHTDRYLGDFLQRQHGVEVAQPGAAVGLGQIHAEQTQVGKPLHDVGADRFVVFFDVFGDLRQLGLGEAAHGILQSALLVCQGKIHDQ